MFWPSILSGNSGCPLPPPRPPKQCRNSGFTWDESTSTFRHRHRHVGRFEVEVPLKWIERPYVFLLARTVIFTAEFRFPVLFCGERPLGPYNLVLSYRRLCNIQHLPEQEEREKEFCPLSGRRGGGEVRWS